MHLFAIVFSTIISLQLTPALPGINGLLSFANHSFSFTISSVANSGSVQKPDKVNHPGINGEINSHNNDYRIKTVVIDAGHGGHDPGCSGASSKEKHIALAISKKLAAAMRAQYPDLKVILTRDKDVFIPLYQRAAIANRHRADLFISIHCNATAKTSTTALGTETYVMGLHTAEYNLDVAKRENSAILLEDNYEQNYDYDPNSPEGHIMLNMFQNAFLEQSILFAEQVERNFATVARRKSRGVKQAGFVVLKSTTMPSVLIESGFLTNPVEEKFLHTAAGQQSIANSILEAFINYKNKVEEAGYSPARPVVPRQLSYESPRTVTHQQEEVASQRDVVPLYRPGSRRSSAANKPPVVSPPPARTSSVGAKEVVPLYRPGSRRQPTIKTYERSVPVAPTGGSGQIRFRVQLAASPGPLNTNATKWTSLSYPVELVIEGNQYKYQARDFRDYDHADRTKTKLQVSGFPDAFIVAYKAGKRIPLPQAKKELGLY